MAYYRRSRRSYGSSYGRSRRRRTKRLGSYRVSRGGIRL